MPVPNNEVASDPVGIGLCSDLCEELFDWSFTLSRTAGNCWYFATIYLLYGFLLSLTHSSFNVILSENMLSYLDYDLKITNNNINSDKSKHSTICHPVDINYHKFTLYFIQLGQPANHFEICLHVCVHRCLGGVFVVTL